MYIVNVSKACIIEEEFWVSSSMKNNYWEFLCLEMQMASGTLSLSEVSTRKFAYISSSKGGYSFSYGCSLSNIVVTVISESWTMDLLPRIWWCFLLLLQDQGFMAVTMPKGLSYTQKWVIVVCTNIRPKN